ncbi:MAG: DUF4349 domain-containing protein [Anaerolineales bacterium]|nr:MAG: DUF4349 domain-containing protein [Anaerolineales bacterium]
MKHILPFSLIVIAAVILAACGAASAPQRSAEGGAEPYYDYAQPAAEPMYAEAPAQEFAGDSSNIAPGGGVEAASVERLIIQNADIAIVVSDVEARMKDIQVMAEQLGGFVVSSNLYQSYTNNYTLVPEATVTIRVPAEKLDQALNQIKEAVVEVQSETRSGQDVTAQYVDLKSRLKNLEAAEAQLNEILQTATETEDVVNIFNQLVYYREQIELVKGQMKYYEEAAALSAVSIRIKAEATIQPIQIGKWEPQGVARDAIQDLIYFFQDFVNFLIRFVIYTLPVWIMVGVPLYLVFLGIRAIVRKVRGSRKPVEPKVEVEVKKK